MLNASFIIYELDRSMASVPGREHPQIEPIHFWFVVHELLWSPVTHSCVHRTCARLQVQRPKPILFIFASLCARTREH